MALFPKVPICYHDAMKDKPVADYPKFVVRLKPIVRARLQAASVILGVSGNQFVGDAVEASLKKIPAKQRKEVEQLAEKIVSRFE